MQVTSVANYYAEFNCIGSKCEDTCCSGWVVNIDKHTYNKYLQSNHPILAPIFQIALVKNTPVSLDSENAFGRLTMKSDRSCHFLEQDKLCSIQKKLGAEMLSSTCKTYPRYINQFGSQREIALALSCPEAARLILLPDEPIYFQQLVLGESADFGKTAPYRYPYENDGDPSQISILNDFRALIIATLQCRSISIGARMMALGFLLEDVNRIVTAEKFTNSCELFPVLDSYASLLSNPAVLEKNFAQMESNTIHKLKFITELIPRVLRVGSSGRFNECLQAAADGLNTALLDEFGVKGDLLTRYQYIHRIFYRPFFKNRQHIFENYLVNQVVARLFPFTRGSYLDLYRELVLNLSVIQILLVGMSATYKGLDEDSVIKLFQSFARKSDHNRGHLDALIKVFSANPKDSFIDVMWLLNDAHV